MSNLTYLEKKQLELLFNMSSGYVLDFSNKTFAEFFDQYGINIYSEEYKKNGESKASRLRTFWEMADNNLVKGVNTALINFAKINSCRFTAEKLVEKRKELLNENVKNKNLTQKKSALKKSIFFVSGAVSVVAGICTILHFFGVK